MAFSAVNDALNDGGAGAPLALAMANLVLDNLAECLTPPQWLQDLQSSPTAQVAQHKQKQQTKDMTGTPIQDMLLDRFYQLPASHSKVADKSHAERTKSTRQFR